MKEHILTLGTITALVILVAIGKTVYEKIEKRLGIDLAWNILVGIMVVFAIAGLLSLGVTILWVLTGYDDRVFTGPYWGK
jgi:hypothetical protein